MRGYSPKSKAHWGPWADDKGKPFIATPMDKKQINPLGPNPDIPKKPKAPRKPVVKKFVLPEVIGRRFRNAKSS